jgi:hypothetical protein
MQPIPFVIGFALAGGAVALLISDGIDSGHWTLNHALQPLLVFGTVSSAVWVHKAKWYLKPSFFFLAVLGSILTTYGTMGRQADTREDRQAEARLSNDQHAEIKLELATAKLAREKECKSGFKEKCTNWQSRVDALRKQLGEVKTAALDPRAEAIARIASLAGANGDQTKAFVSALDPVALPLFLELGSVLFFASAFPSRRPKVRESETLATESEEIVSTLSLSKDAALRDFRSMRQAGDRNY